MKDDLNINVYPGLSDDPNSYISLIKKAFEKAYPNVKFNNFPQLKDLRNEIPPHYLWLNWFENLGSSNLIALLKEVSSKSLEILYYKFRGTKVISVFHNKKPHESKYPLINKYFHLFLLKHTDKIIILSEISKHYIYSLVGEKSKNKIYKIPHPIYNCIPKQYDNNPSKPFTVGFFGQLRPYKNIELILKIASELKNITFEIAGKPISDNYKNELIRLSENYPNIKFQFGHLTDDEINGLLNRCSVMLFPYNKESSLNSGAIMYSLSKKVNVIAPCIGTISDLENKDNTYHYDYNTTEEHISAIKDNINLAFNEYNYNYDNFVQRVNSIYNDIIKNNSINHISDLIKNMNLNHLSH